MTKTEYRYVEPVIPEPPPEPVYYSVEWKKYQFDNGPYFCLDRENAKKLLINKQLRDAYILKLKTILKSLRDRHDGNGERTR